MYLIVYLPPLFEKGICFSGFVKMLWGKCEQNQIKITWPTIAGMYFCGPLKKFGAVLAKQVEIHSKGRKNKLNIFGSKYYDHYLCTPNKMGWHLMAKRSLKVGKQQHPGSR